MSTFITAFSSFISLKREAGWTDRHIFPLYYIICRDIGQPRISVIQYQFILSDKFIQLFFIFQQSQLCLFVGFDADWHSGNILIRMIIEYGGFKYSAGFPPFIVSVSSQISTIFYIPFAAILFEHRIHCIDKPLPIIRVHTLCKLFKRIDIQSIPPDLIKSFTKAYPLFWRLVKPGISVHYFHWHREHFSTALKIILQFLIPADIKQQTLGAIIDDILAHDGIIAASVFQYDSFYPKIRLSSSEDFQICFLHTFRLFAIQNATYGFTLMGAEHPHAFFIAEDITKIIFHIFYMNGKRYAVQNILL